MDSIDASGNLIKGGTCFDSRRFVLASCALSIFMDLIIIPIPSIMVWNLQMERKTKILVVIVMSLGWMYDFSQSCPHLMIQLTLYSATAVSVGRFIVYFYRFAPTNTDRTWDIGIGISLAEPAIHIMTACAPATKCLFRSLFPWFARSRTPAYYADQKTSQRTPRMSKFGSRGSRSKFGSFSFGLGNHNEVEEIDMEGPVAFNLTPKLDHVTEEKRLDRMGSQDTMHGSSQDEVAVEVHAPPRSSYTHTATTTSIGDNVEAEPQHCLGQAV